MAFTFGFAGMESWPTDLTPLLPNIPQQVSFDEDMLNRSDVIIENLDFPQAHDFETPDDSDNSHVSDTPCKSSDGEIAALSRHFTRSNVVLKALRLANDESDVSEESTPVKPHQTDAVFESAQLFSHDESIKATSSCHDVLNAQMRYNHSRLLPSLSQSFVDDLNESVKLNASVSSEEGTPKGRTKSLAQKMDSALLRRVMRSMSGVPPPPAVTKCSLGINEIYERYLERCKDPLRDVTNSTKNSRFDVNESGTKMGVKTVLLAYDNGLSVEWPHARHSRFHGLHYNNSRTSEAIESLLDKYRERYVGCETASSFCCQSNDVPASRRKQKILMQSPGRRLSHLAKRRSSVFSRENLVNNESVGPNSSTSTQRSKRKLCINVNKLSETNKLAQNRLKLPVRRRLVSPSQSPGRAHYNFNATLTSPRGRPARTITTPSSSASRVSHVSTLSNVSDLNGSPFLKSRLTLKRSLFHSPTPEKSLVAGTPSSAGSSDASVFKTPDHSTTLRLHQLSQRKCDSVKRALFQSPVKVQAKICDGNLNVNGKRKRDESEEQEERKETVSKMPRMSDRKIDEKASDMNEIIKKKLLWAVSDTLKHHQITMTHSHFKTYAAHLVKICKYVMCSKTAPSHASTTSERMSRIMRSHAMDVIKGGKSGDQVIAELKVSAQTGSGRAKVRGYVPATTS